MQFTFLSLLTILLTILKAHCLIDLSWWMVFAPGIVDLVRAMLKSLEESARREELREYFEKIMLENGLEDYEDDK